ncbi:MAG: hypothetical protein DMG72_17875 [Acidobacteria bacterium]|nr:MAG: hypothetical protein DMG72_17875 [Acidobacteriota bacterium]
MQYQAEALRIVVERRPDGDFKDMDPVFPLTLGACADGLFLHGNFHDLDLSPALASFITA